MSETGATATSSIAASNVCFQAVAGPTSTAEMGAQAGNYFHFGGRWPTVRCQNTQQEKRTSELLPPRSGIGRYR
ncbi:hypothetical protein ABIA24_005772 [Sinorhizobium fredii]